MNDGDLLKGYLARTGLDGRPAPDRAGLFALHWAHVLAIPFENLDPLAGVTPALDDSALYDKLVTRRRGGYCFEQNLLMARVLVAAGFTVSCHAARVLWHAPEGSDEQTLLRSLPPTHLCLKVRTQEEEFIVDVGFGGLTPPRPLDFVSGLVQSSSHEDFRLLHTGDDWIVQARMPAGWKSLYAMDPRERFQPDLEMMNWWVATHPESRFVNHLVLARVHEQGRHALLDTRLSSYDLAGKLRCTEASDQKALTAMLRDYFGLSVQAESGLLQTLSGLF